MNFMRFIVLRSCFCMCTLPMLWPMPLDSLFFCFPPIICSRSASIGTFRGWTRLL